MNRIEHLLTILGEECNEIGQRASKALRFGLSEIQPGQPLTNAERIVEEYADLQGVIEMLVDEGKLVIGDLRAAIDAKKAKIEEHLLFSANCGTLTPDTHLQPTGNNASSNGQRTP